jgi:bacterioferritin (cytochrome b1)
MGFANDGQLRELESPSMKMAEKTGAPIQMKRSEVINTKIQFVETTLAKLKNFKVTEDTKEILLASLALHEHVLTAYKNEYTGLARSYDDGVSKEQLVKQAQLIHEKYHSRYDELYKKLITPGKSYAAKHDIKVNWGM